MIARGRGPIAAGAAAAARAACERARRGTPRTSAPNSGRLSARTRAEREQRALQVLGQRAVRADQAQAGADLGVELVVHALGVLALADELAHFGVVLRRSAVRSRLHGVAAQRGRVAHGRDRGLPVDLDHRRGRGRPGQGARRARPAPDVTLARGRRRVSRRGARRRSRTGSQGTIVAVPSGAASASEAWGANRHGTPLRADSNGTSPKPSYTDG